MIPIGLQLWTVRESMAKDPHGTLRRIADIGYQGVELWFKEWPRDPEPLRRTLEETGLKAPSAHVPFVSLRDGFAAVASFHRAIGTRYLTVPFLAPELRSNAGEWKARVREMAAIGRACRDAGFQLAYHNHDFEFQSTVDGAEAHDYIFSTLDSDLLKAELDTYFIKSVGKDPAAHIRRYAGRLPLLHLKDQHPSRPGWSTEVGRGTIDWKAVIEAARASAVEWLFVEQDCREHPELESVAMSLAYLRGEAWR